MENFSHHQASVEHAIAVAEQFCRGDDASAGPSGGVYAAIVATENDSCVAMHVAKCAANVANAMDYAADSPKGVAANADAAFARALAAVGLHAAHARADVRADGNAVVQAASADEARLRSLNLGEFPELGGVIDPSEDGPLGPLWPMGLPQWAAKLQNEST